MVQQQRLVDFPGPLVAFDERQVAILDELSEGRDGPEDGFLLGGVVAEADSGKEFLGGLAGLPNIQDLGGAYLDLPQGPPLIAVSDMVGFAAAVPDFEQEAA